MRLTSFLAVAIGLGFAFAAQAAVYPVPFFTGPQTASNIYTDGQGGQWQAMSEEPFGVGLGSLRSMQWSDPNSRWERTTAGLIHQPDNGTYESGPRLTVLNTNAYPAITFIAPIAGNYSIDGTGIINGVNARVYVSTFPSGGGASTTLGGNFAQNGTLTNVAYDFGAVVDYQNLALAAGDRIHIATYKGGSEVATLTTLDLGGGDPVSIIGPAIPEPTLMGLIAAMMTLGAAGRRRSR